MSGATATYMVTEPVFSYELRARLLHAAAMGEVVSFDAVVINTAFERNEPQTFTVRVNGAQFDAPGAFDVTDSDGHIIQIKLPELGPVEFTLYT